ncbi:dynamin family protein [Rothia sp. ZJ932]|uniref:dynamin family protein n=1 Tax=Rothia sp. ZJ932 TaxID=2810516 RepID=UPI001F0816C9|nr:dynamin family protein [Rothia sp. ZJ932]
MAKVETESKMTALSRSVEQVQVAWELGQGRVDPTVLVDVERVLERTASRRELSAEHTVIGFFGATGSGKSTLFNAVVGKELARSAARRPTTSTAQAAVWGEAGSQELLDWLQVKNATVMDSSGDDAAQALNSAQVPVTTGFWNRVKTSVGRGSTETAQGGLILLDLPDFDSVEASNRTLVERMVSMVDVLVWVVDPQKYADAVIHDDFIAPLAEHGGVMLAVLNQADRLDEAEIPHVLDSLKLLLAQDGLTGNLLAPPLAVSAMTGYNIAKLRETLGRVAVEKSAAVARIGADVETARASLAAHDGGGIPGGITGTSTRTLENKLYEASGAPQVVKAAGDAYKLHAAQSTGWIPTRWLLKMRKDPLKRLHLHEDHSGEPLSKSSLPPLNPSQKAAMSSALRSFATSSAQGTGEPWSHSIRDAARSREAELPNALERSIARTNYRATKKQWWWQLFNVIQWLGIAAALVGLLWLTGIFAAQYFQIQLPPPPYVEGFPFPLPTLLVMTGLLLGIVIAALGRVCAAIGHKIYARKIERQIFSHVSDTTRDYVVEPVRKELERREAYVDALYNARLSN